MNKSLLLLFFRKEDSSLALFGAALLTFATAAPALAQTQDPAPYLHTPTHQAPKHVAKHKPVPVITQHHVGPVRRAPRHAVKAPPPAPVAPHAQTPPKKPEPPKLPPDIGPNSGLKLPRYAALKSDDVNMRTGPGERYPILWRYQRRDLPIKIEHEFDIWRQVEDMDGVKGWLQQGFLTGHRSFVITGTDDRVLRAGANDTADAVAILKPGVVGRIHSCEAGRDWCQVQVQGYAGWLKRADFWGADPDEAITP